MAERRSSARPRCDLTVTPLWRDAPRTSLLRQTSATKVIAAPDSLAATTRSLTDAMRTGFRDALIAP